MCVRCDHPPHILDTMHSIKRGSVSTNYRYLRVPGSLISLECCLAYKSNHMSGFLIQLYRCHCFCVTCQANVTLTGMNQYMNRYIPPVEFGMMHQLLFQMLLIPLTMSKRLLAIISTHSSTRTLFPYEDIVGFHIFLGYWFCWLLFVRT